MKYGSVCSGIEAATVAWHTMGWEPQFFSEIERFPRAVLAHHYPDVPCHGDFTTIEADSYGPIELLVGGTPCQSFSVAGLRGGMDDDRGNLALEYIRLARRKGARWVAWENVPGVLSSSAGDDFRCFLAGLAGWNVQIPPGGWSNSGVITPAPGGYGLCWRVLDAQYFGVAQRRRRVFVVGYLGDWRPAAAVLFERESMLGHPAPSREKREGAASFTPGSIGGYREGVGTLRANGGDVGPGSETLISEIAGTLSGRPTGGGFPGTDEACDGYVQPVMPVLSSGQTRVDIPEHDVAGTLSDGAHNGGGLNGQDAYGGRIMAVAFDTTQITHPENLHTVVGSLTSRGPDGNGAPQVDAGHYIPVAFQANATADQASAAGDNIAPTMVNNSPPAVAFKPGSSADSYSIGAQEEVACTLEAGGGGNNRQAVAFKPSHYTRGKDGAPSEVVPPLSADADKGDQDPVVLTSNSEKSYQCPKCGEWNSERELPYCDYCGQCVLTQGVTLHGSDGTARAASFTDTASAIRTKPPGSIENSTTTAAMHSMQVRRLTPIECERLQGFPDGYTAIPWCGKPVDKCPDGPRYKALGNSMAVPVMRWIGERIQMVDDEIAYQANAGVLLGMSCSGKEKETNPL